MRIVIELKNDVAPQKVLNWLYKHTELEKNFNLNMIALVNGIEPRLLTLRDILAEYLSIGRRSSRAAPSSISAKRRNARISSKGL